jgi:hypothetical protein
MKMVFIAEREFKMADFSFEPVAGTPELSAPQGPGTNALVQTPFVFEPVEQVDVLAAPQGPGTNALVQTPFAWGE